MVSLSTRSLVATALLAATASAGNPIFLNFDDVVVSNDNSCGKGILPNTQRFHGVFPSSNFGSNLVVLNTTETSACHSGKNTIFGVDTTHRATSGTNVAFSDAGDITFQLDEPNPNAFLVNGSSYDASVQLIADELKAANVIIEINTLMSDFGDGGNSSTAVFHTATDGFGPFHITAPNDERYLFIEISASVTIDGKPNSFRHPLLFVDNVLLEASIPVSA